MADKVVTRFAPSPTGLLHGGNYRTAVFAYLFAKKSGGEFIVRIEDTDKERSKKEYEENILDTLSWLKLQSDHFYRQSDHVTRHTELLQKLIAEDKAYVSKETPKEEGQRVEVIRFRNPKLPLTFRDEIRGDITIDTTDLGDFVIGRSLTEPLFHFGVVVDDIDEGVTHIVRGEDHISNTPRQILIQHALGQMTPPVYAHLPLVLGSDRTKLSKRRGAEALTQYRDEGYLPEAMINYLALLGWHPTSNKELFTIKELIEEFDLSRIQKGAGIFDETKLRWFNHEHLKRLSDVEFKRRLEEFRGGEKVDSRVVPLLKERSRTFKEAADAIAAGEYRFLDDSILYDPQLLLQGAKAEAVAVKSNLGSTKTSLEALSDEDFTAEKIKEVIFPFATQQGRASVLWPMRVALSGKEKSPDPFTLAGLLGKEKTLKRIEEAVKML